MMDNRIEVAGSPVIYTTAKEPPYNPLKRPEVRYGFPVFALVLYIAVTVSVFVYFTCPTSFIIWVIWTCIYMVTVSKKIIIWCIKLYQNKAPDTVRLRCVFEPSCSEYMILAIEKYGVLKGVNKGIDRLKRCHPPNGGIDYP